MPGWAWAFGGKVADARQVALKAVGHLKAARRLKAVGPSKAARPPSKDRPQANGEGLAWWKRLVS